MMALARIAGYLGAHNKSFVISFANAANLTDLREHASILLGGGHNSWQQRLNTFRFKPSCDAMTDLCTVQDSRTGKIIGSLDTNQQIGRISHGYAIVVREFSYLTGQPTVMLGGIDPYGTSAATDLMVSSTFFNEFSKQAPADWAKHDVEIVVETDVVNGHPGPPRVIAADFGK